MSSRRIRIHSRRHYSLAPVPIPVIMHNLLNIRLKSMRLCTHITISIFFVPTSITHKLHLHPTHQSQRLKTQHLFVHVFSHFNTILLHIKRQMRHTRPTRADNRDVATLLHNPKHRRNSNTIRTSNLTTPNPIPTSTHPLKKLTHRARKLIRSPPLHPIFLHFRSSAQLSFALGLQLGVETAFSADGGFAGARGAVVVCGAEGACAGGGGSGALLFGTVSAHVTFLKCRGNSRDWTYIAYQDRALGALLKYTGTLRPIIANGTRILAEIRAAAFPLHWVPRITW